MSLCRPLESLSSSLRDFGLNGEGNGRLRQRDAGKAYGIGFVSHGVAGKSVTQFGHSAHVACVQFRHGTRFFPCGTERCASFSEVLRVKFCNVASFFTTPENTF